ncbi:MAG: hypothetical protein ACX939_03260 [Hyphococcus sp.]
MGVRVDIDRCTLRIHQLRGHGNEAQLLRARGISVLRKKKWAATRSAVDNNPPKHAYIKVGAFNRLAISNCFEHFLATGRNLRVGEVWVRIGGFVLVAAVIGAATTYFSPANQLFTVYPALRIGAAVAVGVVCFFGLMLLVSVVRRWVNNTSPLHSHSLARTFDKDNAPRWAEYAAKTLRYRAKHVVVEPLQELQHDRDTPFRILKKFAPLRPWKFYRPEKYRRCDPAGEDDEALINVDALCGGLLHILGARPEPRFTDGGRAGDPVLQNYYWRYDAQQMPDNIHEDIFLRFHQSTVERPLRSACRFKTYAAISNFRKTPILILRVKDVIDCLRNKDDAHSEHMSEIYHDLSLVRPGNIIETLAAQSYDRHPPRMQRFTADSVSLAPTRGAILFENDIDDWKMLFDAARVWAPDGSETRRYMEAVVALRRAIDLVSHSRAFNVVLDRRDVLVVNNLRVLIGRWEDRPSFFPWRDSVASVFNHLEGRWLRQIYGFPAPNGAQNGHHDAVAASETANLAVDGQQLNEALAEQAKVGAIA